MINNLARKILPLSLQRKIDGYLQSGAFWDIPDERHAIARTLKKFSMQLKGKVLDIGAGDKPYKNFFAHLTYHSSDMQQSFFPDQQHDLVCSVYKISCPDKIYDACLLIQVMEHLEEPIKALQEVNRILVDNGQVYISVPQGAGDHFIPHHYFNFTRYGLEYVLKKAGFEIVHYERLDGIFTYVANRMMKLGHIVEEQYSKNILLRPGLKALKFCCWFSGLIISKFNFIDRKRHYCVGHYCVARKMAIAKT